MSPLHLPNNAACTLERAYNGDASTSEFDKWLIYTTAGVAPTDTKDLCYKAMKAYNDQALREPESEWESLGFLKPADQSHVDVQSRSLQHILDHHLNMISQQLPRFQSDPEDKKKFYIFGFIALTRSNWREHGVTAVLCDKDRGKWKVTQCSGIPVVELGMALTSVSDGDDSFDNIRNKFDARGNDHADNQGGPAPEGKWQFLAFCTNGTFQMEAERLVPDPRGGPDWGMGEGCLWFLDWESNAEEIWCDFPLAYANAVRDPTAPSTGGAMRICKIHPLLFVVVDGEKVQVARMDWDREVARSDAELRRVGEESRTSVQSCDPAGVVSTLEQLAMND